MDDLIRRADAIDAFMTATADGDKFEWCEWVLKQLPSAERKTGRWIPCSERMPNPAKHVLVTLRWGEDDYEVTELDVGVDMACGSHFVKYMVAWMPLPEPWKGDADAD